MRELYRYKRAISNLCLVFVLIRSEFRMSEFLCWICLLLALTHAGQCWKSNQFVLVNDLEPKRTLTMSSKSALGLLFASHFAYLWKVSGLECSRLRDSSGKKVGNQCSATGKLWGGSYKRENHPSQFRLRIIENNLYYIQAWMIMIDQYSMTLAAYWIGSM